MVWMSGCPFCLELSYVYLVYEVQLYLDKFDTKLFYVTYDMRCGMTNIINLLIQWEKKEIVHPPPPHSLDKFVKKLYVHNMYMLRK